MKMKKSEIFELMVNRVSQLVVTSVLLSVNRNSLSNNWKIEWGFE